MQFRPPQHYRKEGPAPLFCFLQERVKKKIISPMSDITPTVSKTTRPTWDEFWFTIALFYSTRGTCDRLRTACILVDKNKHLVGAGYNGSLPGSPHCDEVGHLMVDGHCLRTLHSEVNAILHSAGDLEGASAYMIGEPCIDCVKKLLSKKVKRILFTTAYDNQERGGQYIFDLAKSQGAEIKKVEIDFHELLQKKFGILTGPGGAFHSAGLKITFAIYPAKEEGS